MTEDSPTQDAAMSKPKWRAEVLDVRGPAARGRQFGSAARSDALGTGDHGTLWIADDTLVFSGAREAWTVPLGWLDTPRGDLSGVIHLRIVTDDHGRDVAFRLANGAGDEPGLAEAIQGVVTAEPDPRDRRALEDLLALLEHELSRLDVAANGAMDGDNAAKAAYAGRAGMAATRARAIWLPYWGRPASRLREAGVGLLTAVAEASAADADDRAQTRHQEAVRRWQQVCEELNQRWGLPSTATPLPSPAIVRVAEAPVTTAVLPPLAELHPPMPPSTSSTQGQVPDQDARRDVAVADEAREGDDNTTQITSGGMPHVPERSSPRSADEIDPEATIIMSTAQAPDAGATAKAPVAPALEPFASVDRPQDDDGAAVLTPRPPLPSPSDAERPLNAAAAGVGPGRKGSGGMTMLYRRGGPGPLGSAARKELLSSALVDPSVEEAFLGIGRRFAAVRHRNFVRILETGRDPATGIPHIDMEFVEGETVSAHQRGGHMRPEQAFDIVDQIAAAIDAVHAAGLVHGDVRPENMLIEPGGRVVLLEPSVAVDHELEQRRGTIYGELPYLTLERVLGEPDVPSSDIYALGIVAYALLAGRPPWEGDAAAIFGGHASGSPPPLERFVPDAPPAANAVLASALAKAVEQRPPTAAAFAGVLRRSFLGPAAAEPPVGAVPPGQFGTPRPQPSRSPGPLGRVVRPAPVEPPTRDDEPPDDLDRTIIVPPRR